MPSQLEREAAMQVELDAILSILRYVDLPALQEVNWNWAQAVAEAKDRLRDLGAE